MYTNLAERERGSEGEQLAQVIGIGVVVACTGARLERRSVVACP